MPHEVRKPVDLSVWGWMAGRQPFPLAVPSEISGLVRATGQRLGLGTVCFEITLIGEKKWDFVPCQLLG